MDYLLLLSSILAGTLTVLVLRLDERSHVRVFNAFTGAYLLCVTFFHLLPELYGPAGMAGARHYVIGVLILAGFYLQILLDTISLGVEHGHTHELHQRLPLGVMLGLCLHAFVEALALGNPQNHHDAASRRLLLWSIVIHNYPVSVALLGMLLHSGMPRARALMLLAVFAGMGPLGMNLSSNTGLTQYSRELTALVIGIFLHISTTILFESSDLHRFKLQKVLALLLGTMLGTLTVVLH
jgi:zinc transporter ZupT